MSSRDAVALASRTLALLLVVWALSDVSYLPAAVHSFLRYANDGIVQSNATQYWRHHYLIELGFLLTRIVGYSLLAKWLYAGGPDVEDLFLPSSSPEAGEHN
ncbi:MAG: hypothetical protein ACLQLC_00035 [Candidatus Sulfotelmatobacter sp.]